MDHPLGRPAEGETLLATNAPAGWPAIAAPLAEAGESASGVVARLTSAVARGLKEAGLTVKPGREVAIGQQRVRVDLVAGTASGEVPIFVFPGLDAEREGTMFVFLRAAMSETGAFVSPPLYYARERLRFAASPSTERLARASDAFLALAHRGGSTLSLASRSDEVVDAVRAFAGAPVEQGGGDTVMEAAAFIGEWLRAAAGAEWVVREDLPRTVLLVQDLSRSTQWHVPLFAWFPDAVRMGYDGLHALLERLVEAAHGTDALEDLEALPLSSPTYREAAQAWVEAGDGTARERTMLLRRCAICGDMSASEVAFGGPASDVGVALARTLAVQQAPRSPCASCAGVDYRESVFLYETTLAFRRLLIVAEFFESHVQVATRELTFVDPLA